MKMRIVLVTDFTPTADNINGPSALCYYIFKALSENNDVFVISTNSNKVKGFVMNDSMNTFKNRLTIVQRNFLMKLLVWKKTRALFSLFYPHDMPTLGRYKLPNRIVKRIKDLNPDVVVFYPMSMIGPLKQLKDQKTLVIGPDCFALHYIRSLRNDIYKTNKLDYNLKRLKQEVYLAKNVSMYADGIALVGREDCQTFNKITNANNAFFLPHPHYSLIEKKINLLKPKLKVIITGNYNEYTEDDVDVMVKSLIKECNSLNMYEFTFLGKTWKPIVDTLSSFFSVEHKTWVDDYVDELKNYDIQIFPICLGSGTKGKVLDAASTGLLCIGSYYSFENIALQPGVSCILYKSASNIPKILVDVSENKKKYQDFAMKARDSIRMYHNVNNTVERINDWLNKRSTECNENPYLFIQ